MRNLYDPGIDQYRRRGAGVILRFGTEGNHRAGMFELPSATAEGVTLRVVASVGKGWDHLSVSTRRRCPVWEEMEQVKRLFFQPGECAMQLHVPVAEHINHCPYCLHIWRPHKKAIPRPPGWRVGPRPDGG